MNANSLPCWEYFYRWSEPIEFKDALNHASNRQQAFEAIDATAGAEDGERPDGKPPPLMG